jgi:hypothetical protein
VTIFRFVGVEGAIGSGLINFFRLETITSL